MRTRVGNSLYFLIQFIVVVFISLELDRSYGWHYEVQAGFGYGQEIDNSNINYGYFLNGKVYKFKKIDRKLILTLDASLAYWMTNKTDYRELFVAAFSPTFRGYFVDPDKYRYRPYLQAGFGPAYLSQNRFGHGKQDYHFAFQASFSGGIEFDIKKHIVDVSLMFIHYCNAGIFHRNIGIDIPFVYIIGFQF